MSNWIASLLAACVAAIPASATIAPEPPWQQLYAVSDSKSGLSTVWADDEEWVAAGKSLVARGKSKGEQPTGGIETKELPGKTVLGIDRVGHDLYAVGADQLVLRLAGTEWVEEHFEVPAPRATARQKYASVLYAARMASSEGTQPLIAYGPWRVIVRQTDGTWSQPPEAERSRLLVASQLGPEIHRPERCALASWRWLRGTRAWFTCHDGRSFIHDGNKQEPTGVLPKACKQASDGLAERGTKLNVLCAGKVWRSENGRWVTRPAPKGTIAIAANARCLFAATASTVSKTCPAE